MVPYGGALPSNTKILPGFMTENRTNGVTIIKATRELQSRVGSGELDISTRQRAHEAMTVGLKTDFTPIALGFLDHLELGIARARDTGLSTRLRLENLSRPVMELKANARMFRYDLVSVLANIMLGFLESIQDIDCDAVEIVAAHHRTLRVIIERQMTGNGGPPGQAIINELQDACNRYFTRRGMKPLSVSMI